MLYLQEYDLNLDPNGPFIKFNTEFGKLILTYNMAHPAMRELQKDSHGQ